MSDRNIFPEKIEKILNSYVDQKAQEYVTYKVASIVEKNLPSYEKGAINLSQYTKDIKGDAMVLKDVIFLLAKQKKVVVTTNPKGEIYFMKTMIYSKS